MKLNIKWSGKIEKAVKEHPLWLGANIGSFWKIHSPRCTKIEFPEVIWIKWTRQMESILAHWQRLRLRNKLWYLVHLVKVHDRLICITIFFSGSKTKHAFWLNDYKVNLIYYLVYDLLKQITTQQAFIKHFDKFGEFINYLPVPSQ